MKSKIGNAIGVFLAVVLCILIASGPISLIGFIVTKNYLILDYSAIYGVIAASLYYFYHLSVWFSSLGINK